MKYLYYIYQLLVAFPIIIIVTILTCIGITTCCLFGGGNKPSYYFGKWWGWIIIRAFLLPVTVEGRENISDGQSYVFVANHQGAFDIFLLYGFLDRNFKWMMKSGIKKIPFVGFACKMSKQIFVGRNENTVKTYNLARKTLAGGTSMVVFPEGSRTYDGKMIPFKKGAFVLADELQLPIIPITINGVFKVMPRTKDWHFANWSPLRVTIHQPIYPVDKGMRNIVTITRQSFDSVQSALEI